MILRSPSPSLQVSINCIRKTVSSITFNPYAQLIVKNILDMDNLHLIIYYFLNMYYHIFNSENKHIVTCIFQQHYTAK